MRENFAFILVELMVVMFVISFLVGIVSVQVRRVKVKSRDSARLAENLIRQTAIRFNFALRMNWQKIPARLTSTIRQVAAGIATQFVKDNLNGF